MPSFWRLFFVFFFYISPHNSQWCDDPILRACRRGYAMSHRACRRAVWAARAQAGAPYVRPRIVNCRCSGGHRGPRSKAYSEGGGSESRFRLVREKARATKAGVRAMYVFIPANQFNIELCLDTISVLNRIDWFLPLPTRSGWFLSPTCSSGLSLYPLVVWRSLGYCVVIASALDSVN